MTHASAGGLLCCATVVTGAVAFGGGQAHQAYQIPIGDAYQRLQRIGVPTRVFGEAKTEAQAVTNGPAEIVWPVSEKGIERLRLVADLTPVGNAATNISVTVAPPVSGAPFHPNASIETLYAVAMQEQIGAVLQRRRYRWTVVYPAMMRAAVMNAGALGSGPIDVSVAI